MGWSTGQCINDVPSLREAQNGALSNAFPRGAPKALLSPVADDGTVFAAQANFMPGGLALLLTLQRGQQ